MRPKSTPMPPAVSAMPNTLVPTLPASVTRREGEGAAVTPRLYSNGAVAVSVPESESDSESVPDSESDSRFRPRIRIRRLGRVHFGTTGGGSLGGVDLIVVLASIKASPLRGSLREP
jgi:hypothetical protein